jgi:MFS family permease
MDQDTRYDRSDGSEEREARIIRADDRTVVVDRDADASDDPGIREAHDRFGGLDIPASLTGMLTALAVVLLLGGILAAAVGTIAYQIGFRGNQNELSIGSLIGGVVVLFLAFLIGGWAAGRIARYDGGLNGAMTAVWFLLLTAILAGLGIWFGDQYNVVGNANLPNWFSNWFSSDEVTTGAVISGIAAVLAMFLGGFLGGFWGQRFHKRADATIAATRKGSIGFRGRRPVARDVDG